MGQIDQISTDQVKIRQRFGKKTHLSMCVTIWSCYGCVHWTSVTHLHLHHWKTGITGWEENYIGQLLVRVWLHTHRWVPPLSLIEAFLLASDLNHTAIGCCKKVHWSSPRQTIACVENACIHNRKSWQSNKRKKANSGLCTEVISYH